MKLQVFLFFTAFAWLEVAYHYLDDVTRGRQDRFVEIFLEQQTGVYGVYVLLPLIFWAAARRRWYEHAGCLFLFSFLHTSWNWGTRLVLFPLLGQGSYDYGAMPVRYAMEFPLDVIGLSIGAVLRWQLLEWRRGQEIERALAGARMELLTRQLQPHFLFNALNTISALMYEDVAKADRVLGKLSNLLRGTLDLRDAATISLGEELRLLDSYVAVIEARHEQRVVITIQCAADLHEIQVPPLLLQPLVENAIEHGRNPISGIVSVDVSITRTGHVIDCRVEDRGPGLGARQSGYGLEAVAKRLDTLYGPRAQSSIADREGGGTVARVEFPV